MSANVTCTECGMVLDVLVVYNYHLMSDGVTAYYHVPYLNDHMQLHEGGDHV